MLLQRSTPPTPTPRPKPDDREKAIRRRLRDDFAFYASRCLKIRAKSGKIQPLGLNSAQRFIHEQAEDQRRRTGKVRKIILKGRQQGCSTYVEGRFYWRVTHRRGVRAFILAHEREASQNLFEMADRYHANCPDLVRPHTSASNAKELHFDLLDSGYKVATAGTRATGRSATIQYFHGSEVSYWPFAETHAAGAMQTVPDEPDTEIWLESTANGAGNYFHIMWQKAMRGEGDFEPIFVPWFWQSEYRRPVPEGWQRTDDEDTLAKRFKLTDDQLAWRRNKVAELDNREDGEVRSVTGDDAFRQEYPNTPEEAFAAPVLGSYYGSLIEKAEAEERIGVVRYDPRALVTTAWDLGFGDDTVIWFAQIIGKSVHIIDYYANNSTALDVYCKIVKEKPYSYHQHLLPHDGAKGELIAGSTIVKTVTDLVDGEVEVLPRLPPEEGINAARLLLPRCWFDEAKCKEGLRALRLYRRQYNEERKVFSDKAYHDWTSHAADAFRYLAMGLKERRAPKKTPALPPRGANGWMGN